MKYLPCVALLLTCPLMLVGADTPTAPQSKLVDSIDQQVSQYIKVHDFDGLNNFIAENPKSIQRKHLQEAQIETKEAAKKIGHLHPWDAVPAVMALAGVGLTAFYAYQVYQSIQDFEAAKNRSARSRENIQVELVMECLVTGVCGGYGIKYLLNLYNARHNQKQYQKALALETLLRKSLQ